MLDYAAKLTREPWNMVEDDVKALKREGFTNVGILHEPVGRILCLRQPFGGWTRSGTGKLLGKRGTGFVTISVRGESFKLAPLKYFPFQYKFPPCHIVISGLAFISLIFLSNLDRRLSRSLN